MQCVCSNDLCAECPEYAAICSLSRAIHTTMLFTVPQLHLHYYSKPRGWVACLLHQGSAQEAFMAIVCSSERDTFFFLRVKALEDWLSFGTEVSKTECASVGALVTADDSWRSALQTSCLCRLTVCTLVDICKGRMLLTLRQR